MDKNITIQNLEVNVYEGGQLNVAQDEGYIEAKQYNNVKESNDFVINLLEVVNGQEYVHKVKENGIHEYRKLTEKDVIDFPDSKIEEFKSQLGTRLNGTESKLDIISAFLREMEDTIQLGKRYDVMPIFSEIPRNKTTGYIYLDECILPFDCVELQVFYWDAFEKYLIDNKYYFLYAITFDGKLAYVEFGYKLAFPDVNERLYGFCKAEKLVNSKKICLLISDENKRIEIDTKLMGVAWQRQIELTNYWIEQMKKIDAIEKYFKIKFHLPIKASEEDYIAIEILNESIKKLPSSTFPPLQLRKELFRKSFKISDEILIGVEKTFSDLQLFGYCFHPVAAYIIECTLFWKKKLKAMETEKGGVPVRVEFVCYKE